MIDLFARFNRAVSAFFANPPAPEATDDQDTIPAGDVDVSHGSEVKEFARFMPVRVYSVGHKGKEEFSFRAVSDESSDGFAEAVMLAVREARTREEEMYFILTSPCGERICKIHINCYLSVTFLDWLHPHRLGLMRAERARHEREVMAA